MLKISPSASLPTNEQNHYLTSLSTVLVLKSVSRACDHREAHQMSVGYIKLNLSKNEFILPPKQFYSISGPLS